jgi:predicted nicotinamide N-methyase
MAWGREEAIKVKNEKFENEKIDIIIASDIIYLEREF